MKIAVIGGGAAGFFAALSCKSHHPDAHVCIFEKSSKFLSKVKVSGGGRCNVTNHTFNNNQLSKNYPRGEKQLKKLFNQFNAEDTVNWFAKRGVKMYTQPEDNCMFPVSDDSQTIIDCFLKEANKLGVQLQLNHAVTSFQKMENRYLVKFKNQNEQLFDRIIITTGGAPKRSQLEWIEKENQPIIDPVPSLFTFNMPKEPITKLMGVVVDNAWIRVQGTKLKDEGILLITHWGMSGPVVLKLSAWGARVLSEMNYNFNIQVSWVAEFNEHKVKELILEQITGREKQQIKNAKVFQLPTRLWEYLIEKSEIDPTTPWNQLGKKAWNKLLIVLTNDVYSVKGKTTFKEEFVTCGGVALSDVNMKTMESHINPGVYYAGEVLDIDGITGGYNFQAAWTTGFIAGKLQ